VTSTLGWSSHSLTSDASPQATRILSDCNSRRRAERRAGVMGRFLSAAIVGTAVVTAVAAAQAQDRRVDLAARLKQELARTSQVNAVQIDGKTLQVVVNDREIYEENYRALVMATCTQLGREARQFTEIAFGNRFAEQGYVFTAPAKCDEILKMAPERQ